jgi:polysaccharide biosynthesis/export protein
VFRIVRVRAANFTKSEPQKMPTLLITILLTATLFTASAQERFPQSAPDAGPNLPAQPIGPNDLIAVSVYGAPELTRTIRVSTDGLIRLPMVKQKIAARGLMPAELESKIAEALADEEILVDPAVTVTIAEYHSRPISVAGAVKRPITFQAVGKTTLLEALTRAEGLNTDAGSEILISRPARNGLPPVVERIRVNGLIDAADPALNVTLEGGEEIRVPQVGRVFVVGNVKKPGAFRMEDGFGMTVLKALAMAEGLAPYATREAYVYRRGFSPAPGLTQTTQQLAQQSAQEVPIDLRKILDRKSPDVALGANDIFYIPDNRKSRIAMGVLDKTLGFATSTASGILVLSHP